MYVELCMYCTVHTYSTVLSTDEPDLICTYQESEETDKDGKNREGGMNQWVIYLR